MEWLFTLVGLIFVFLSTANFLALGYALLKSDRDKFKKGSFRSRTALRILDNLEENLIFLTFCVLLIGLIGFALVLNARSYNETGADAFMDCRYFTVSSWLMLFVFEFVFGFIAVVLIIAKAFAQLFPEKTLRNLAIPLYVILYITTPVRVPLIWLTKKLLKSLHLQPSELNLNHRNKSVEFAKLVYEKESAGDFDKEDERMLKGVMGLSDTVAREIMTPRTELAVVQIQDTLEEVCAVIRENNFSRYPVIDQSIDNVVGILLAKDLMLYLEGCRSDDLEQSEQFSVSKIMRVPYFIAEDKPVDDLLTAFKTKKLHIAIVLDEHGGVDGIVTLEDLLEEIVGDIFDESDDLEKEIVEKDGKVIVDGGVLVCDLNAEYGFGIPENSGYDTVAGFLYNALGRVPQNGDFVEIENGSIFLKSSTETRLEGDEEENNKTVQRYRMTVKKIDDFKIEEVEIAKVVNP